jgi:glutathione S-transferase
MALIDANIDFEVREISLRNKPESLVKISPKATVPVLLLQSGQVIDQSLDIMLWAYRFFPVHGRVHWLDSVGQQIHQDMQSWISLNDDVFKKILDAYKYPERFPNQVHDEVLSKAVEQYLYPIEKNLSNQEFILGNGLTLVDLALFPFIRQFIRVNDERFNTLGLNSISRWVNHFESSNIYLQAMVKFPTWLEYVE